MSIRFNRFLAASLPWVITCSLAQSTVGELLDAGGKKHTKADLVAKLSGYKLTGLTSQGSKMNIDLKADGTLSGSIISNRAGESGTVGTWTVDDAGKFCIDETLIAWNMKHRECVYFYRLGEQNYKTTSDSEDRNTKIVKRDAGF